MIERTITVSLDFFIDGPGLDLRFADGVGHTYREGMKLAQVGWSLIANPENEGARQHNERVRERCVDFVRDLIAQLLDREEKEGNDLIAKRTIDHRGHIENLQMARQMLNGETDD